MGVPDYVILAVVIIWFAAAIRSIIRNKGGCCSGGGCGSACSACKMGGGASNMCGNGHCGKCREGRTANRVENAKACRGCGPKENVR